MKKTLLALLLVIGLAGTPLAQTYAGGASWNTDITPSANSAVSDGSSTITISVHAYYYMCSQHNSDGSTISSTDPNYCANNGAGTASVQGQNISGATISATGSGNTLSATTLTTNSSGIGSFTIKSTVAEAKTIGIASYPGATPFATTTVTFNAPTPAPKTTTTTTTPRTTTTTPTPTTTITPAAPAAPSMTTATVDGDKVTTTNTSQPITVEATKPLVLSGTTVPNGTVTLTIHSTPKTVTVQADKDGIWSYSVTGLEPGSHYVEASVTDPVTNKVSDTVKLLSFAVTEPQTVHISTGPNTPAYPAKTTKLNPWVMTGIASGAAAILGAGGWYGWRLWRKRTVKQASNTGDIPPQTPTDHTETPSAPTDQTQQ